MRRILLVAWLLVFCLALAVSACGPLAAQDSSREKDKATAAKDANQVPAVDKRNNAKAKPAVSVTPAREAAAMAFVKQHHAEVAELLVQLKAGNDKEYEKAIRELFRTSERLAQIRERDMPQYELELKLWQVQSRVQLLSARVKMTANRELRDELRAALNEQIDARLALLRRERERLSDRVDAIDQQLLKMEENRRQAINRQIEALAVSEKGNVAIDRDSTPKKKQTPKTVRPGLKPSTNSPAGS